MRGRRTWARRRAGWAVGAWKRGGREGGRCLRRGGAEATVARLAMRGGLAATAAGEGDTGRIIICFRLNARARSNFICLARGDASVRVVGRKRIVW